MLMGLACFGLCIRGALSPLPSAVKNEDPIELSLRGGLLCVEIPFIHLV